MATSTSTARPKNLVCFNRNTSFAINRKNVETLFINCIEYVAGSVAGQSLGYQARGTAIPVVDRTQRFPIFPAAVSVNQKLVDYTYASVDDDRDGFPDNIATSFLGDRNKGQVVRVTSPAETSFQNPSTILSVINPAISAAISQPSVVRVTSPAETSFQNPSNILSVSNRNPALPAAISQPSVVRLTSPAKKPSKVRVVNPATTISNQQQVVRLNSPNKNTVVQPARQVIKQSRRKPQRFVQSVRSPFYTNNLGQQQFVTRSPILSSGSRLDQFFGGLNTVRDRYGRLVVRGNIPATSYTPSFQTVVFDDDLDDIFDDLDILDDDDTFIVNSASFGR